MILDTFGNFLDQDDTYAYIYAYGYTNDNY